MSTTHTSSHDRLGKIRILHVDDDPSFADMAATFLQQEDERFAVETATSAEDGLDQLGKEQFDCVVSDYNMPGQNGIDFLNAVRETHPDLPYILFTGKGSEEIASDAISAGVSDYLQKGTGTERYSLLANRIRNLVTQHRAETQLETRAEQQRRVAELGQTALADDSLQALFDAAVTTVAETLGTDYAKVLEYRPEHEDLLLRAGTGWQDGLVGEGTVGTGEDSQAGHTIRSEEPIIVENLRTEERFQGPPLLVEHDVVSGISVIIGSADDPWGVLGTHTTDRTAVTDDDLNFVRNVANVLANAIDRTAYERELQQKNRRYQAVFNDPNILVGLIDTDGTVRDINQTALEYIDATLDDVTGEPFWETPWFDHSEAVKADVRNWIDRAAAGEYVEFEIDLERPDGDLYTIAGVFRPVTDEDGEIVSLLISDRDITERKTRENELEQTNALLSTLFDALPQGVLAEDASRNVITVNEQIFDLFELPGSPEDVVGADCEQMAEAVSNMFTDSEQFVERIDELIAEREPVDGEELPLADGRTFERSHRPIELPGGEGHLWLYRDVTDRKTHEQELETVQRRFEAVLENTTTPMFMKDDEGRYIFVNQAYCELFDLRNEEIVGRTDHEIHPPEMAAEVQKNDQAVIEREQPIETEERIVVNGTDRIFLSTKVPIYDTGERFNPDTPVAVFGVATDITDRKKAEQQLREEQQFVQSIFQSLPDPLYAFDTDGYPIRWNEQFEEVTGYSGTEIEETYVTEFVPDDECDKIATNFQTILDEKRSVTVESAFETNDRARIPYEFTGGPLEDADGTIRGVTGIGRDITERKAREQQLEAKNDQLEAFASIVSHDLRNPLSVASGRLELAAEECDSDHLDHVEQAHERMRTLIEELLTLAREGEAVTDFEPVDLSSLVEGCWDVVERDEAALVVDIERAIRADESRLRQVFENLMRNSIEHGGENVTVRVGELADGFYVEDDGPGIPSGERDHIFEAGYSTSEGGTGFGLSIVKEIVEAHGWQISVTEGATGGARFEITGVEITTV